MPRQAGLDAQGTLRQVILRVIEKRRIVDGEKDQRNIVGRLGDLTGKTGCQYLPFPKTCYMEEKSNRNSEST
jgi:hypothetical protein